MALTKKTSLLLVFIFVLIANAPSQGLDTTDYFPLNVGDSYSYRNAYPCPPDTVQERYYSLLSSTNDTVWIEGKKYFVKDRFFLSPDTLRIDEQGNVVVRNWSEDRVFYKMNAAVGDTWSFPLGYKNGNPPFYRVTLQSRNDSITVHAGRFRHCLRFYFRSGSTEITDWLAPDVGLVFRCVDEPTELYEAQVKGVKYPRVTSVQENKMNPIMDFVLYPNYPNPFNPQTTVRYELKSGGYVTLRITDVLGREIRTLVNEFVSPGRYEVKWDGKDAEGRSVGSDIYFYTLRIDGFHLSKKLLFIK